MTKKLLKTLSVFLSIVLIFQTLEIGVFGANEVYLEIPVTESTIEAEYTSEMTVYSGYHQKTAGRAGTFSFNDFTLIPRHSFKAINISSNIYPVDINFNFNSPEQRFLENVDSINNKVYGDGWMLNYGKLICEVEYSDTREMYLFDGEGNCEVFVRTENVTDEEASEFPQRQKWVSKYGYSNTTIWKIPDRYIDYSTLATNVPEQYAVVEASGEISRYDAFGRLREKRNSAAVFSIDYVTGIDAAPEAVSVITDGMGNEFRFTYDNNKLARIKAYNSDGTAITAGNGNAAMPLEVSFTYTGDLLTSFTFPDGESIFFTYDTNGNITSAVNIDLSKIEMEYFEGHISKITEKAYDAADESYITGNILTVTKNSATVRTFTDNYNGTQIKTFDNSGNILTITDENGNLLFDSTQPEDEETTEEETTEEETTEEEFINLCPCEECPEYECICECDSEEICTCIQCKRSVATEYDDFGNITSETFFDGTRTLISELSVYSEDGTQLLSSTDSSGNTAYYSYSDAGFLQTVSAGTSSGCASYDAMGNLLSFSQSVSGLADGSSMSNTYTYENDKIKSISHNGFTYEFEYDAWGNQTKAKIGTTVLSQNTYGTAENADRLSSTTFANGQTVSYVYDDNDNITSVSYDGGLTSRYSYIYDEDGILQSVTDNASGLKTIYTENGTELRKTSDNSILFSTSADENGNVIHNIAGDSITYVYNGSYNSTTGINTDIVSFENEVTLTSDGVSTAYSNSADIVTDTDWFGRVNSKTLSIDTVKDGITYSIDSNLTLSYADTDTTATTKVTSLTSTVTNGTNTVGGQEYYEYDSVGNITGIYRIEENEKIYYNRYYYDEANQIVREDNRLGEFTSTYTYDVGGNIVSRIRYPYTEGDLNGLTATESHTYSYDNALWGDVLTSYNGQSVSYDAMGNITSFDGKTYVWTAGRQLSRVIDTENNSYVDYFYDDNGQISYFALYRNSVLSSTYQYIWEGTTLLGMRMCDYALGENNNLIENEVIRSRIIYDADGEPLGYLLKDAEPFLYTKNILGDITGIVNGVTGQLILEYVYDAYGNMSIVTPNNSVGDILASVLVMASNPLSYRGYVFAPVSGYCHYLGSRFYVPQLCRFMNADIYADTAQGVVGTNMFAYCNNNPIFFVDPSGNNAINNLYGIFSKVIKAINSLYRMFLNNGGNTINNAMSIKMESSTYASIENTKESDWFKFKTTVFGAINIYTESELNTKITLYTKNLFGKEKLLISDDNSGKQKNARIEYEIIPNKQYYIKVSSTKKGGYQLFLESNFDRLYSPSGGAWIADSKEYETYGNYTFHKKVFLTASEAQAYYIMVSNDEFREFRDELLAIPFDVAFAIISERFPIFKNPILAGLLFDWLVMENIPTFTEIELNSIAQAGNMQADGTFNNGIVITSFSTFSPTAPPAGDMLLTYSNSYTSWTDEYITGVRFCRGQFDINDKKPLW